MTGRTRSALAADAACGLLTSALAAGQSALSKAQEAAIAKKIAGTNATEKKMVADWPDGKKLAEFFCAEVGLKEIAKQHKGADRLFLGPDDEGVKRFTVDGNRRVAGDGNCASAGCTIGRAPEIGAGHRASAPCTNLSNSTSYCSDATSQARSTSVDGSSAAKWAVRFVAHERRRGSA